MAPPEHRVARSGGEVQPPRAWTAAPTVRALGYNGGATLFALFAAAGSLAEDTHVMNGFNRFVAVALWLLLLAACLALAISPTGALEQLQTLTARLLESLTRMRDGNPSNFLIGQIAFGVGGVVLLSLLLWGELATMRRRGVRIVTAEGGSAELDTNSIGRRLAWHLDQLAEVVTVMPIVRSRGSAVDIKLEIEAAPDVDIPLKTEEVVQVTREVIEQELGLRMGRLDVHMRCAPFEPDWA